MKKHLFAGAALAAAVLLPVVAIAHGGATGIVKERMDLMKAMGEDMTLISDMIHGKKPYDAAAVREAAEAIAARGGDKIVSGFPEGTGHAPSEALPTVWQQPDRFRALAEDVTTYATALAEAADNPRHMSGAASMGAMMGGTGDTGGMMGMMDGGTPDMAALAAGAPEPAFMALADTCSACHETFRAEKDH